MSRYLTLEKLTFRPCSTKKGLRLVSGREETWKKTAKVVNVEIVTLKQMEHREFCRFLRGDYRIM